MKEEHTEVIIKTREEEVRNFLNRNVVNDSFMPHAMDRPGQMEAFQFIRSSNARFTFINLPTGIGKTAIGAYISAFGFSVLALTRKKSLQDENYGKLYDFAPIFGKGNYPCGNNLRLNTDTCDLPYNKLMKEYRVGRKEIFGRFCGSKCKYYQALNRARYHPRVSANYALWLTNKSEEFNQPDFVFMDEGHELIDMTIEASGFTVKWDQPFIAGWSSQSKTTITTPNRGVTVVTSLCHWVKEQKPEPETPDEEDTPKFKKEKKVWERTYNKLVNTLNLLGIAKREGNLDAWFFDSTAEGLNIRPKTAKYTFKKLFIDRYPQAKYIIASATMTPDIATALGLEDGEWDYFEAPNPFPPLIRPIVDLKCPKMTYKSTPMDKRIQAAKIINVLNDHPDKSAVVIVNSNAQANALAQILRKTGKKVFVPPRDLGTDAKLAAWNRFRQPGAVCVNCSFQEGANLQNDGVLIMGKVPYPDFGDKFVRSRNKFNPEETKYAVARMIVQMLGRNRRGNKEDYFPRGAKIVCIADGAWTNLKEYLPEDFLKCVVTR